MVLSDDTPGAEQKFHQLPDGKMDGRHRGHLTFHVLALSVSAPRVGAFSRRGKCYVSLKMRFSVSLVSRSTSSKSTEVR